jgi:phenylalanine-4-hydroxylase
LTVDCVNFAYDITEPQPQLFVCEDFAHLANVLSEFAPRLAYKRGGRYGLETARAADTVNTVQLDSGIQLSGRLSEFLLFEDQPAYLRFSGPCQLAVGYQELTGQSTREHAQGFSTPVGRLKDQPRDLSDFNEDDLAKVSLQRGERGKLQFSSGIVIEGKVLNWTYAEKKLVIISWVDCRVTWGERLLFDPSWGTFDMAVGHTVTSVFGGPADRERFGQVDDFVAQTIPMKKLTSKQRQRQARFQAIRDLRDQQNKKAEEKFKILLDEYESDATPDWLQGIELLELSYNWPSHSEWSDKVLNALARAPLYSKDMGECLTDGISLAKTNSPYRA